MTDILSVFRSMHAARERARGGSVCVCQPTFWCDAWTGPLEVERRSSALRILSNLRDDSAQRLLINILYHSILLSTWAVFRSLDSSRHSPCSAKHPGPSCGPQPHSIPSTTQPSLFSSPIRIRVRTPELSRTSLHSLSPSRRPLLSQPQHTPTSAAAGR